MAEKPDIMRLPVELAAALSTTAPEVEIEVVPAPSATDLLVEAWFVETFHGVPDLKVEHFNRFRAAADRLKARLSGKE